MGVEDDRPCDYLEKMAFDGLAEAALAADIVGAVTLSIGLFGHSEPLMLGYSRVPERVARDHAFATIGTLFLCLGFVGQALASDRFGWRASRQGMLIEGAGVLVLASLAAFSLYGMAYWFALLREERFLAARVARGDRDWQWAAEWFHIRRRGGLRWWLPDLEWGSKEAQRRAGIDTDAERS
jgi:hypothetical protein